MTEGIAQVGFDFEDETLFEVAHMADLDQGHAEQAEEIRGVGRHDNHRHPRP